MVRSAAIIALRLFQVLCALVRAGLLCVLWLVVKLAPAHVRREIAIRTGGRGMRAQ